MTNPLENNQTVGIAVQMAWVDKDGMETSKSVGFLLGKEFIEDGQRKLLHQRVDKALEALSNKDGLE